MAAKDAVTILGFTATADEWTAWSAIGTVAAAVVAVTALLLPLYIGVYRKGRENIEARFMRRRVIIFLDNALDLMRRSAEAHDTAAMFSLSDCAAVARYESQVLKHLAVGPNMDILATVCAFGAAEMLDIVVTADNYMRDEKPVNATVNMILAERIEANVRADVAALARVWRVKRLEADIQQNDAG